MTDTTKVTVRTVCRVRLATHDAGTWTLTKTGDVLHDTGPRAVTPWPLWPR